MSWRDLDRKWAREELAELRKPTPWWVPLVRFVLVYGGTALALLILYLTFRR